MSHRFLIEVQHSSDHCRDGKWFELDRCETEEQALKLVAHYGLAYAGRPIRYRIWE